MVKQNHNVWSDEGCIQFKYETVVLISDKGNGGGGGGGGGTTESLREDQSNESSGIVGNSSRISVDSAGRTISVKLLASP